MFCLHVKRQKERKFNKSTRRLNFILTNQQFISIFSMWCVYVFVYVYLYVYIFPIILLQLSLFFIVFFFCIFFLFFCNNYFKPPAFIPVIDAQFNILVSFLMHTHTHTCILRVNCVNITSQKVCFCNADLCRC